jgi:hypothetical protein
VKATPGTLQEGGASFATTHWSVPSNSYRDDNIHADSDTCGESNANSYGHVYANPNSNSYCNGNPDCNASLC